MLTFCVIYFFFLVVCFAVSVFPLPYALSSPMLGSYSALLKTLQEVIHREGFDLSTPMVRATIDLQFCICFCLLHSRVREFLAVQRL